MPMNEAKFERPEAEISPFPDRKVLALARDQVQVESALTRLRQAMGSVDDLLLAGVQARRRVLVLESTIREALDLAVHGAEWCTVLAHLREALS
jgi:hypothetical protein